MIHNMSFLRRGAAQMLIAVLISVVSITTAGRTAFGQQPRTPAGRCLAFELYLEGAAEGEAAEKPAIQQAMERFARAQPGIGLRVMDLAANESAKPRLESLAKHFKIDAKPP